MTLVSGMKLWYVPRDTRWHEPREVTVERVGRKWAYLGRDLRIDIDDLRADGGKNQSPGRCYGSREEWEASTLRSKTWDRLRRNMPYGPPEGVDTGDITKAAELLGVALGEIE